MFYYTLTFLTPLVSMVSFRLSYLSQNISICLALVGSVFLWIWKAVYWCWSHRYDFTCRIRKEWWDRLWFFWLCWPWTCLYYQMFYYCSDWFCWSCSSLFCHLKTQVSAASSDQMAVPQTKTIIKCISSYGCFQTMNYSFQECLPHSLLFQSIFCPHWLFFYLPLIFHL